jgi:hypothetical protein
VEGTFDLYGLKLFNCNILNCIAGDAASTRLNVMKAHNTLGHVGIQGVKTVSAKLG